MKVIDNLRKNTILLVIITMVVLYFVLKDDFSGIVDVLKTIDLKYIFLALLFYLASVTLKGTVNYLIINDKKKISIIEAIKQNLIAQFFNGITPFSTGGEPMAIYMLTEEGIPFAKATNYMVQSFIFYQIALVLCGFIAVTYNFIFSIYPTVRFLQLLVLLGFIINIIVALLLFLSASKRTTNFIYKIVIKISKLLRRKVNEEEIKKKFDEYSACFKELKNRKGLTVLGVFINMLSLLFLYITPLFVLYGMGDFKSLDIMTTFVSSSYVYLIGAFVPIPGASGGIEYGFTQFFGNFLSVQIVSATLLVWRFITYYFGIVLGAILFNLREKVRK